MPDSLGGKYDDSLVPNRVSGSFGTLSPAEEAEAITQGVSLDSLVGMGARFLAGLANLPVDVQHAGVVAPSGGMVSDVDVARAQAEQASVGGRIVDLAETMVGLGGGPAGTVGSGVRGFTYGKSAPLDFTERMAAGKDAAMARANKGQGAGGNLGTTAKRAPLAPKGSFERLADEIHAKWQADKQNALDEFRRAAGTAPEENVLLAPGETLDDFWGTTLGSGSRKAAPFMAATAAPQEGQSLAQSIRAYHASPHDFEQFDISKMPLRKGQDPEVRNKFIKDFGDHVKELEKELSDSQNKTHNYVVFDDQLISILKKYGVLGLLGLEEALPQQQQDPQL